LVAGTIKGIGRVAVGIRRPAKGLFLCEGGSAGEKEAGREQQGRQLPQEASSGVLHVFKARHGHMNRRRKRRVRSSLGLVKISSSSEISTIWPPSMKTM